MPVYPCHWPTCAAFVSRRGGYCPAHATHGRQDRRTRDQHYDRHARNPESRTFYNSAAWLRARATKLAHVPVCERCRKFANTVHHRVPLERCTAEQRLAQENLMSVCPGCHAAIEHELARATVGRRVVVCGPPGSGKTTWVQARRRPGDVVWDFDVIAAVMTARPPHDRPAELIGMFEAMRDAATGWLAAHPTSGDVYVILANAERAAAVARELPAQLVTLDATEAECVRRITADASRGNRRGEQIEAIRLWFAAEAAKGA